jgi:hypothetical protein
VQVGPDIQDTLGRLMDQDRDGTAGEPVDDRFTAVFRHVTAGSAAMIVDDGDPGYTTVGAWSTYNGVGTQGDFDYKAVGSGTETASWTLGGLAPGEYRVSVTWEPFSNRAVDAPYTVLDGVTALGTVAVNQTLAPADFAEDGVSWQDLGTYQLNGSSLTVELSDQAGPAGSFVIADAVRVELIGAAPPAPEIEVQAGGSDVADGAGLVDFGDTPVGTPVSQTFTVSNVGTLDLSLGATITLPSGYSLVSGFGSTLLAPGQSTTFEMQLDGAVEGSYGGTVSFANDDADENPFDFSVSGTVSVVPPPPVILVLDNGDPGYSATGGWKTYIGAGAQGDFDHKKVGSGTETASWTLGGLAPGEYRVSVTWEPYRNRAEDAPYTVLDGVTALGTVAVNQTLAPADFTEDGVSWQDLGTYQLSGSSLTVELSDQAGPSGRKVIADAVRVERVGE